MQNCIAQASSKLFAMMKGITNKWFTECSKEAPFGHHPSKCNGLLIPHPHPLYSVSSLHSHSALRYQSGQKSLDTWLRWVLASFRALKGGVIDFVQTWQPSRLSTQLLLLCLYKDLEHQWILCPQEPWNQPPEEYWGATVHWMWWA